MYHRLGLSFYYDGLSSLFVGLGKLVGSLSALRESVHTPRSRIPLALMMVHNKKEADKDT